MIRETTIAAINKKAQSQKKISHYVEGLKDVMLVINYINSLDEFASEVWDGHTLEDVMLPKELADFVMPASVRYNSSDRRTSDLLVRPHTFDLNISYAEYVECCDRFRNNFKKDASSDMISFASVRKHVNLNDIIDRICIDDKVNYYSGPYVPISIKDISALFEDRYFNDSASSVLDDYIAGIRFN